METNQKPYPISGISHDWIKGNPHQYEQKEDIDIKLADTDYEIESYLDHHSDCYYYYATRWNGTAHKPYELIIITAEASQDKELVKAMLIRSIQEREA